MLLINSYRQGFILLSAFLIRLLNSTWRSTRTLRYVPTNWWIFTNNYIYESFCLSNLHTMQNFIQALRVTRSNILTKVRFTVFCCQGFEQEKGIHVHPIHFFFFVSTFSVCCPCTWWLKRGSIMSYQQFSGHLD